MPARDPVDGDARPVDLVDIGIKSVLDPNFVAVLGDAVAEWKPPEQLFGKLLPEGGCATLLSSLGQQGAVCVAIDRSDDLRVEEPQRPIQKLTEGLIVDAAGIHDPGI